MERKKLTEKQEQVLTVIKKAIAEKGYPPTVREIGNKVGLSSSATTQFHICKLQEKGYIKKDDTKNRTIELLVPNEYADKKANIVSIPLLGNVTAGSPIEAIETPDEYIQVPGFMIPKTKEIFALHVKGESMINAGIFDGDVIIVERRDTAKNGEKIVAMTEENEVTVKTFYKEKDHIRLQPENDTMAPIILPNVTVLGKVIGLFRKMA